MDNDQRDMLRAVGQLGSLGFTLVLTTFAGLGLGLLLDKLTNLKPLFTIACLLFGIISGFVYIIVKYARNDDKH
jgi:F0F1-type ATP synthase assembly protein I